MSVQGSVPPKVPRSGLTESILHDKLLRLGNDPIDIVQFKVELEQGLHLPLRELNQVRRDLVRLWEEARLAPYRKQGCGG